MPTPILEELHADAIEWELRPMPDPLTMTRDDMILESTIDAFAYRLLACEALDHLYRRTVQADRQREQIAELRTRLR